MTEALRYINQLTGDNYPVWVVRIKVLHVSKGLWHLTNPTVDENEIYDRQKSAQALALINPALKEERMVHIEECQTAPKGWRKLKSVYAEPSTENRERLYKKLFTLRLKDSEIGRQIYKILQEHVLSCAELE